MRVDLSNGRLRVSDASLLYAAISYLLNFCLRLLRFFCLAFSAIFSGVDASDARCFPFLSLSCASRFASGDILCLCLCFLFLSISCAASLASGDKFSCLFPFCSLSFTFITSSFCCRCLCFLSLYISCAASLASGDKFRCFFFVCYLFSLLLLPYSDWMKGPFVWLLSVLYSASSVLLFYQKMVLVIFFHYLQLLLLAEMIEQDLCFLIAPSWLPICRLSVCPSIFCCCLLIAPSCLPIGCLSRLLLVKMIEQDLCFLIAPSWLPIFCLSVCPSIFCCCLLMAPSCLPIFCLSLCLRHILPSTSYWLNSLPINFLLLIILSIIFVQPAIM